MNFKDSNPGLELFPDSAELLKLAETRMPFGKYAGIRLVDLPEPYVVWFHRRGSLKDGLEGCLKPSMRSR